MVHHDDALGRLTEGGGLLEDMSAAQTPARAASWPVELALAPTFDPAFYGELVQFGEVLPWETGIPVPHTAAA